MAAKQSLYETILTFRVDNHFQDLVEFAIARHDAMPREWTEAAISTFYPGKFDRNDAGDGEFKKADLMLSIIADAYADSLEEAKSLLAVWQQVVPEHLQASLVSTSSVRPLSWKEYFDNQDILSPCHTGKDHWAINSILTHPDVETRDVGSASPITLYNTIGY